MPARWLPRSVRRRTGRRWPATLAGAGLASVVVGLPAPALATLDNCAPAGTNIRAAPWAQESLDPERAWPFADGRGVTVAVISSGVDAGQPQLAGHVLAGADFITGAGTRPANTDCAGLGTQVAGVIAAQQSPLVGFRGFAPAAMILPVAVSDTEEVAPAAGTARALATGIRWAVQHGATVLAIPLVNHTDDPALHAAVDAAIAADVVIVAAAASSTGVAADSTAYPASYPGVIAVGAAQPDGTLAPGSPTRSDVSLIGPGADLVSTQRAGGLVPVSGAGIATGYVSAVAALVRGRWPSLTAHEVANRIDVTATPASGGPADGHGYGLVNPYQAVTDAIVAGQPRPLPTLQAAAADTRRRARAAAWLAGRRRAVLLTAVGLGLTVLIVLAAAALPRGRRRGWRATLPEATPADPGQDLPAPPRQLFEDV